MISVNLIGCQGQSKENDEDRQKEVAVLLSAIRTSDTLTIRRLVAKGVNMDPAFDFRMNYFIAVELNDVYGIAMLIAKRHEPISFFDETPLMRTIKNDNIGMVRILIDYHDARSSASVLNYVRTKEMFDFLRNERVKPDNKTPFHLVDVDLPISLRQLLAANECTQYSKNEEGITLIDYARSKNAVRILESIDLFYNSK